MASLISHAVAALAIGPALVKPENPRHIWLIGTVLAMFPDVDVVGFRFGVRYGDFWGHRGFTHSLVFATILASFASAIFVRGKSSPNRVYVWIFFFLATASHGLLDAMTNGGLGIAFFSPFDNTRYFFAWRPIAVSPISVSAFFGSRGLAVLQSEFLWIWLPATVLALLALSLRGTRGGKDAKCISD